VRPKPTAPCHSLAAVVPRTSPKGESELSVRRYGRGASGAGKGSASRHTILTISANVAASQTWYGRGAPVDTIFYRRLTDRCFNPIVRRLLLFATLFTLALALAPGAQATTRIDLRQFAGTGTAAVSLVNGTGKATMVRRAGAILGSVGKGRVTVTAPRGRRPAASFSGCDERRRPNRRTVVCLGRGLHFSTSRDLRVAIRGSRVYVSAVMRGRVTLEGTNGTYSIEGVGRGSWPRVSRTWSVGG
jgi:hypothetical protein